jgi:quercetin dioxygenase-like cupin family protein
MSIVKHDFVEPFRTEEKEIETSFSYIDNVWVRQLHFKKKGMKNDAHKHLHDHATLLAHGSLKATVEGQETIFKAPCMILVLKDQLHYFEALEDNTVAYCVHGIREDDGTGPIISPEMIPNGASVEEITHKYGPYAK